VNTTETSASPALFAATAPTRRKLLTQKLVGILFGSMVLIILIPLLILLGYYFGASIWWLAEVITRIDYLLRILAVVGCVAALIFYLWLRRKPSSHSQ
jgi:membrane protein DedA with SNARE-associated domain